MKQIYVGSAYNISKHAIARMKSRNISNNDIDFIINNGLFERTEKDRTIYRIPESLFSSLGNESRQRLNGAGVILSIDGCIVTVFWKDDRFTSLTGSMV